MIALLWVLLFLDAAAAAYPLGLAIGAMMPKGKRQTDDGLQRRLAVIVPAHNEVELIGGLLQSLLAQDYPLDRFEIHLIADNCSDATAAVGRSYGVLVHERIDPAHPGKGQALSWLLESLDQEPGIDAYVFVDADSTVDAGFLSVLNRELGFGDVLQASYRVSDPERSVLTSLRALAFALMHDLRGRGKTRLGLSCGLWGNGMAMSRSVLKVVPWQSFSAVEDGEQHIRLLLEGYKVQFVAGTHVYGHMPSTFKASRDQQRRWEGGKVYLARRYSGALLLRAIRSRSAPAVAALLDLVLPPLSVQVLFTAALMPLVWLLEDSSQMLVALCAAFAVSAYVVLGLVAARFPARVYGALAYAPVYLGWKVWLFAGQLFQRVGPVWVKTLRDS